MGVIVSPIQNHANRIYSHRTGWARMWAECLDCDLVYSGDWSEQDEVYLEHGMEFNEDSKGLNYFLGDSKSWDKLAKRGKMIERFNGRYLFSLDIECPDYGERLKSRLCAKSSNAFKRLDFDRISRVCKNAIKLDQEDLIRNGLVLGDSHALSAWRTDAFLCRLDGQTLYSAARDGFRQWVKPFSQYRAGYYRQLHFVRFYFGNIDMRHHVCRIYNKESERFEYIKDLIESYMDAVSEIQKEYLVTDIEIVGTLPIENESRLLPKTGYYKGQPFWGSQLERKAASIYFNDMLSNACSERSFHFIGWPSYFLNDEGELDFSYMEKPRSVHISPEHYLWKAV